MEQSPPCKTREEAFELVKKLWIEANLCMEATDEAIQPFRELELCERHGWKDLDRDPCYLPSIQKTNVRLYIHNNGTIVIQRMEHGVHPILLFKLGCGQPMKKKSAAHREATIDELS